MTRAQPRRCCAAALAGLVALGGCGGGGGGGGGGGSGGARGALEIRAVGGASSSETGEAFHDGEVQIGGGGMVLVVGVAATEVLILATDPGGPPIVAPDIEPDLGENPRVVDSDLRLRPGAGGTVTGDVDASAPATGLRVERGATLTLVPGHESVLAAGADTAIVEVSHAIVIEGSVLLAPREDGSSRAADLAFVCASLAVGVHGLIDASGRAARSEGEPGLDGGELTVNTRGLIVQRGAIRVRGGEGRTTSAGGDGGSVALSNLEDPGGVYSVGVLDVSGGRSPEGDGGAGGRIALFASDLAGGTFLDGEVLARGGAGETSGGDGGVVDTGSAPVSVSTARIDVSGGAASAGGGGAGGTFNTQDAGVTVVRGAIVARGGAGGRASAGGRGGIASVAGEFADGVAIVPGASASGVLVAAGIDVSGGAAGEGGAGGNVFINFEFGDEDLSAEGRSGPLILAGYRRIDVSGGAGVDAGGRGGQLRIEGSLDAPPGGPAPLVRNEAEVICRGGDASKGRGGDAGAVTLGLTRSDARTAVEYAGACDLRGGDGREGGDGGELSIEVVAGIASEGAIDAGGGAGTTGAGGDGGGILLGSDGPVGRVGSITADGGASASGTGGGGGAIILRGGLVRVRGDLRCEGGRGAFGGSGGTGALPVDITFDLPVESGITILGAAGSSSFSGRLSVAGGEGTTASGTEGTITIDGILAALEEGTLSF